MVVVGKIGAPYGIKGWVHLQSFTEYAEAILDFQIWKLKVSNHKDWQDYTVTQIKPHGANFVALLGSMQDRDAAALITNAEIAVVRADLPDLARDDEYYWADLIDLVVVNLQGEELGIVTEVIATKANDVLIVKREETELLIPFILDKYVLSVDLNAGIIQVDWSIEEE